MKPYILFSTTGQGQSLFSQEFIPASKHLTRSERREAQVSGQAACVSPGKQISAVHARANPQAIPPEPTQSKAGFHQHLYIEFTETTPTCLIQTGGSFSVNLIQALNKFFNGFLKGFRGVSEGLQAL